MRAAGVVSLALAALAATPAAASIQHAPLADGREGIYLAGEIVEADLATFEQLAIDYPNAVLFLESPGGVLEPSIEIGKLVHRAGWTTAVLGGSTCQSACALIWLAGTPRYLADDASLGFHASYSEDGSQRVETGVGNAIVGFYLSQLGLSQKAVVFATSASPYDIASLDADNSAEAEIGFETALDVLPQADRALLVDASMLQKAKVAVALTPGSDKPGGRTDSDKVRPPAPVAAPEELTKQRATTRRR